MGSSTTACEDEPRTAPSPTQIPVAPTLSQFASGMVTLTFDDGWVGQAELAAPRLESRGWRGTFYLVPQWFGRARDRERFMTLDQARALANAGHEIGDHTMTHQHLSNLSSADIRQEMVECRRFLAENFGLDPSRVASFASPFGDYDDAVLFQARDLFTSHRTTHAFLNTPSSNPYELGAVSIGVGHPGHPVQSKASIASFIQQAATERKWLVFVIHGVVNGKALRHTDTLLPDFDALLDQIDDAGLRVVTLQQGIEELRGRAGGPPT